VIVRIRLFAHMAGFANPSSLALELAEGAKLSDVQPALLKKFPDLPWPASTMMAVNQEYVPPAQLLKDKDEIAIIPPVSGG
jgi:molybdopterin synthase sulfur carrier subunit